MRLKEFIKENRAEIDQCIRSTLDRPEYKLNDNEREMWILNDEGLYCWARSEGVKI